MVSRRAARPASREAMFYDGHQKCRRSKTYMNISHLKQTAGLCTRFIPPIPPLHTSSLETPSKMPFVNYKTPQGTIKYQYTISTPYSSDADTICPGLPIIFFIHPIYCLQSVYHCECSVTVLPSVLSPVFRIAQFSDPRLRRFNLLSYDLREHGETTGPRIPSTYSEEDAADDVAQLMVSHIGVPGFNES